MKSVHCKNEPASRLPVRKKIGFGIADIGGNLFFTAMGFWSLTYLTDTVYLAPALAGIAVMVAKLWDAVTDPLVGYLSDNTRTRWGRRRPYLLFGALPFGFFLWLFFTNPHIQHQTTLFYWALAILCLLNTAMTCVNIPYSALTPELTSDYNEQTSLNSYRFACAGISTLITFFSVKEPACSYETAAEKKPPFFSAYRSVFKNRAYCILLAVFVLHITALNFLQTMVVYYLKYIYQAEHFSSTVMGALLICALLAIPIAALLSKKCTKRTSYRIGLSVLAAAGIIIFFIGHRIGLTGLLILFIGAGIGVGFAFATPWAMLPDAIASGHEAVHNEGCYYGVWTFASKLGQAVSTGTAGVLLSMSGYLAGSVQSDGTILTIRLISGPVPAAICLIGAVLLHFYISPKKTADIR